MIESSDKQEAVAFINSVENKGVNQGGNASIRKSKRPESVREHASNYRASVGYIGKMKYGEGPRDDTDDSDDEPSSRVKSVRDSHYNRKSNKEQLQETVALLGPMATVFTIFKGFVATAVLFMPYAFVTAGWGFSGISLFVSLILNLISIYKLLQVYKAVGGGSLSELGEKTVGKFGKVLTDILLFFSQFSFCLAYVYFIAQ